MRKKAGDGKTDDQRAEEYIQVVESKIESAKGRNLQYMFLDACYDEDDPDEDYIADPEEKEAFDESMQKLYKLLEKFDGLETSKVNDQVVDKHDAE